MRRRGLDSYTLHLHAKADELAWRAFVTGWDCCPCGNQTEPGTFLCHACSEAKDDTAECENCLGLGGSWSYPNAMSRVWHPCDNISCIDGRVPL